MPSNARLSTYRTTIATDAAGTTRITYFSTCIVAFDDETVTLRHGGWMSVTTKRKMCQASRQFGLGFVVSQRKGTWYVTRLGRAPCGNPSADPAHGAVEVMFREGMTFARGTLPNPNPNAYAEHLATVAARRAAMADAHAAVAARRAV